MRDAIRYTATVATMMLPLGSRLYGSPQQLSHAPSHKRHTLLTVYQQLLCDFTKTHSPESLLVTLFHVAPTHLVFFSIFIGSPSSNALNSNLPRWLVTLLAPLSLLVSALFSVTTLLHLLCILTTPICCLFLVSAQLLPPVVLALQPHSLELTPF